MILSNTITLHPELPLVGCEVQLMLRKVPARRGGRRPFRERNPVVIGAVGLAVIAAMLLLAFNIDKLPLLAGELARGRLLRGRRPQGRRRRTDRRGQGRQGHGGRPGGRATSGSTSGSAGPPTLGARTSATVRIKTILGQKYLALEPAGKGDLTEEIPLSRTTPAYDVVEAFSDLATTTEDIDTDQLATALDTLANTFQDSPEDVRAAVDGLGRLSRTVASRDEQLRELLAARQRRHRRAGRPQQGAGHACSPTATCCCRSCASGARTSTPCWSARSPSSQQLTGLVRDNRAAIGPALANLKNVLATLEANQANLDRSIRLLAPFVRVFANTIGNGRWFDTYIQNLVPVPGGPGSAT